MSEVECFLHVVSEVVRFLHVGVVVEILPMGVPHLSRFEDGSAGLEGAQLRVSV